ncbi:hypothetical protein LTS18_007507 [Coniosporium uncinatum]|uniref:Uncharacterized protein n=1 Tax=Coniosporium uncinatum TaxID=93489 RepID=A0ACC3DAI0_9PEZI|nr:hypothetical protein LTS18_007507 [Coniosporium uncinatum]
MGPYAGSYGLNFGGYSRNVPASSCPPSTRSHTEQPMLPSRGRPSVAQSVASATGETYRYGALTRIPADFVSVAPSSTDGFSHVTSSMSPRTERPFLSRQVYSRGSLSSTGTRDSSSRGSRLQVTVTGRTENVTDLLGRLNFDGPSDKGKARAPEPASTRGREQTRLLERSRFSEYPPPITSSISSYRTEVRAPSHIPPLPSYTPLSAAPSATPGPYLLKARGPSSVASSVRSRPESFSSTSSSRTITPSSYNTRTVAPSRGMNRGYSTVAHDALSGNVSSHGGSRYAPR